MDHSLPARFAQLRLRDLMLLEHLAELGSLTEVAARVHVTQSAVTQALQALEGAFGHRLVTRGRRGQRGVQLNAAGTAALNHLRIAHHELAAAHAAAADPDTPTLRIGALPLALVRPLPDILARLRHRLPGVHVQLTEDIVSGLWRRLETGEVDAIVCRLPALTERLRWPPGVARRTIGDEPMALVAGRRHPMARRRRPTAADLAPCDWVLPPEGSYTRLVVERWFMRAGLPGPQPVISSMSFHTNLRLAAQGELLAVAPRSAALEVRTVLDLVLLPVDWGNDSDVTLLWRDASLGNPAMGALLECLPPAPALASAKVRRHPARPGDEASGFARTA